MSVVEGWGKHRVRDVCDLGRGRVISGQEIERNPGVFPVYSSQSSNNGKMGSIDTFDFDGEYVTWTTDGAYAGTVFYRSGQFNCTNVCGTLHAKDSRISMPFIAYKLSTLAKEHVSYVGNPKLMNGVMANIELSIPTSKPEQTKIAEILSTVDLAIEQTEALIAKQQRIKTGLMQDLLTRGIDEQGNLRTEQTHKFKDTPLGRIPIEWEVQTCATLCREIVVGIVIRPAQYYRPDGVPVLRSTNVKENKINIEDIVFMSERDNEALSKSCLAKGDIVTVRTGYPGTTAVIPSELDGSNCVDVVISKPNREKISSEFLSIWVNSEHGKRQVLEGQGGLAQQHFNVGEMRKLLVKVPDISEQERIANLLILQDSAIDDLAKDQHKLHTIKNALMQDLLTGKKRVTGLLNDTEVSIL